MSPPVRLQDPAGPSSHRALAVAAAVAITALTLAGSLGFGPGAAVASAPSAHTQDSGLPPDAGVVAGQAGSGSGRAAGPQSDGWLSIDKSPGPTSTPGGSPSPAGGASPTDSVALPAGSGSGRRVVYDISAQRVWLVGADDTVARTYLVSGSRQQGLLAPGLYAVYSRSRHAVSLNSKETMNFMVRFAHGRHAAIGFHDIPAYVADGSLAQSLGDLGTPQSAGCIRQREADAKALWQFADTGTAVVVTA